MTYEEWEQGVPAELAGDPLWRMEVYRWRLFAADIAWPDVTKLAADRRTVQLSSQLVDAVGSIGANISEGYSRWSGRDQARFYEYALGSARESRTWDFDARHVLGSKVAAHRMQLLTKIIKHLLKAIPAQRGFKLHEDPLPYADDLLSPSAQVPMPE